MVKFNTLELPNYGKESKITYKHKQQIQETTDGSRYVYKFGEKRKIFTLSWNVLDETTFNQLQDFIENTVDFMYNTFTFTDIDNNTYTVRCTEFNYTKVSFKHYAVDIKLEEEI